MGKEFDSYIYELMGVFLKANSKGEKRLYIIC